MAQLSFAQNNNWTYATMETEGANEISTNNSEAIQILQTNNDISAVYVNLDYVEVLKGRSLHGPGFVKQNDKQSALNSLNFIPNYNKNVLDFTITEDAFVSQCLNSVDHVKIGETIVDLENYGTRFHSQPSGIQAAVDLQNRWQTMATNANRTDVLVEAFPHNFSNQNSVIVTIPGSEFPDEIVIIGAHLDSGDNWNQTNAPGANDNASGIATITEAYRVLLANDFKPKRTVQIMAFAAEEVGLLGSMDIAELYSNQNKNVLGITVFDMVNYHGSEDDVFLVSDPQYISAELNVFYVELMEHYNASGAHKLTYQHSECGYACGDHVSWAVNGFMAAYPFETSEDQDEFYPFYHTPNDTFASMNNDATHSAKFVKLALEFLIEIAKTNNMNTTDLNKNSMQVVVRKNQLLYEIPTNEKLNSFQIVNTQAQVVTNRNSINSSGSVDISHFPSGVYIAIAKNQNGETFTQKFIKK